MSAAVPRPRLSPWPGGAGSPGAFAPFKNINAPIAPECQSFLSNIPVFIAGENRLANVPNQSKNPCCRLTKAGGQAVLVVLDDGWRVDGQ